MKIHRDVTPLPDATNPSFSCHMCTKSCRYTAGLKSHLRANGWKEHEEVDEEWRKENLLTRRSSQHVFMYVSTTYTVYYINYFTKS